MVTEMTGLKVAFLSASASAVGLVGTTATDVVETGVRLSELPAVAMLGVALIVSLMTGYYLIRMMFGRLFKAMEQMTTALQRVADMMENCRAKNDFPRTR